MKNFIIALKIAIVLILMVSGTIDVYSQNVISSVNVSNKATLLINQATTNSGDSEINMNETDNFMSAKSYLEVSNSDYLRSKMLLLNEKVIEKKIGIEDWMTEKSSWKLESNNPVKNDSQRDQIEDWMLEKKFWKIVEEPDQCKIEAWMTDSKFWVMVK